MQKGQTGILILVGILIIGLVAGGAYYLGRQATPKTSPSPVITSQTPQPSPDETVYTESDRSANWKTYTNTTYNFSVQYPSTWYETEGVGKLVGPDGSYNADSVVRLRTNNNPFGGPYIGISVIKNIDNLPAVQYAKKLSSQNQNVYVMKDQPTYLQKYDAIIVNGLPGAGPSGPTALINDKRGNIIELYTTGLEQGVIDSILSSFKLLD